MEQVIPLRLSTLGHPQRLAVFRLLMRRYPDRVPATELARALDLKPNTLSTYVNALMHAGLVSQERVGTSLRYAIDMQTTRATLDYLVNDCCRGRPELCDPQLNTTAMPEAEDRKLNVLFLCTGNSARSIFAESILRTLAGARFEAYSAGVQPKPAVNPIALDVLKHMEHDTTQLRTKTLVELHDAAAPQFDFVFTVCDQAANEDCPVWQGQPISTHWGLPDPVQATGTDAQKSRAFRQTYEALHNRLSAFAALPFAALNRVSLQKAVDDIGQFTPEGSPL